MGDPVFIDQYEWKGVTYVAGVYEATDISNLSNMIQVQTVAVTDNNRVVLLQHRDGWYGLPGGHLEEGEDLEQALRRELLEEVAAKLLNFQVIGYEKIYDQDQPNRVSHLVRCVSGVELLDEEEYSDPDDKSLGREVVSIDEALKKIGYGKRGPFWIKRASVVHSAHD